MFKDNEFLDHDDWYVKKKIDKYNSIIELTSKAPTEAENELRKYYAYYFSDGHGHVVGEYTDKKTGKTYVVDREGRIIKEGKVNRKIYDAMIFY